MCEVALYMNECMHGGVCLHAEMKFYVQYISAYVYRYEYLLKKHMNEMVNDTY